MENNDIKMLIETFRGYRDLLTPIQINLHDFAETYDMLKEDIDKLASAFDGDIKGNLDKIYKNLSTQVERSTDLSSRIDQFIKQTNKYTSDIARLANVFLSIESKIAAVNELEKRAEEQISKLDAILEEKKKNYNVKELQKTLDSYNANVTKLSEFINKDVADALIQNNKKLDAIKSVNDGLAKRMESENSNMEKLLMTFKSSNEMLKRITEREDVNEAYIFDILDRWAESRKVKIKKQKD